MGDRKTLRDLRNQVNSPHVIQALLQKKWDGDLGVPYQITGDATGRIDGRDWDDVREHYVDYLIDLIEASYLPGPTARILKRVAHSPLDLERKLSGAVRGTIPHGAMVPYQSGSLRPIPELGHYRTPVPNVYLCGSGTHPGAGVSMASGRNAAQTIFDDLHLNFTATFKQ
jgi:phytoene dehydrogenase-like protein